MEPFELTIEDDPTQYSRYLCPDLHQCLKYEGRECEECGKKLEFIGMLNDRELNKKLGELQIAKFTNL